MSSHVVVVSCDVLDTGNHSPTHQPPCRVPPFRRKEVQKLLQDMERRDVIQPASSSWASTVVLVGKKVGHCVFVSTTASYVNSIAYKDAYPIPSIDDILDTLAGYTWFTTLDPVSGWQLEVLDKDRENTAFCTQEGIFEFKVMPFGLCNALVTFKHLMDIVLAEAKWSACLVYLDDIVIVGKTFHQHLANTRDVLDKLRQAGLCLKPGNVLFSWPRSITWGILYLRKEWLRITYLPQPQHITGEVNGDIVEQSHTVAREVHCETFRPLRSKCLTAIYPPCYVIAQQRPRLV